MKPLDRPPSLSRRAFLAAGASGAGLLAADRSAEANPRPASASPINRFEYDVQRLRRVDPALLSHAPLRRTAISQSPLRRLALAPDGRLCLAAAQSLLLLNDDASIEREWRQPAPVRAVATHAGHFFLSLKDHVRVLDPDGRVVADWPTVPGRPFLTGLAATANDLFAADSGNRVVLRYDRSGKLMRRIGEKDPQRNIPGFVVPSPCLDVEVGPEGLVWVNNPGRHRVEAYTPDGEPEFAWGRTSTAIDGFCGCCNPTGIALLPDGRCVTFEKGLPRVKIFRRDGHLESVVAGPDAFADASREYRPFDPDDMPVGTLDGVVDTAGRVHVVDILGATLQSFAPRTPSAKGA